MKIILVTGGFDPLHSGHLAYFKAARELGDYLIVGVNSDEWLERKKGQAFMPLHERVCIISNLVMVNEVWTFNDKDGSARQFIKKVRHFFPTDKLIFVNGGDRTAENIPEMDVIDSNLEFKFGVGGENKKNSSSWILQEWKAPKTKRNWGYYRILHENGKEVKLKELTVEPGKRLSMQRHKHRAEHWFVSEGEATIYTLNDNRIELLGIYDKFDHIHINTEQWHQLFNGSSEPLKIVEIQYGNICVEEDIERL